MYYLYVLQNEINDKFYVGQTRNIEERLKRHNEGRSNYTKNKGEWKLSYFEKYNTRTNAIKREREIKNKKSKEYIGKLIDKGLIKN